MTQQEAEAFAQRWIDAWNRHEAKSILEHYADDVVYTSPMIARMLEKPDATIVGIDQLRTYVAMGLASYPDLRLELKQVFAGANSIVMTYKSIGGVDAAETLLLNPNGKAMRVLCHYHSEPPIR